MYAGTHPVVVIGQRVGIVAVTVIHGDIRPELRLGDLQVLFVDALAVPLFHDFRAVLQRQQFQLVDACIERG
ncbi:hypothetical protein D3C76_1661620 [compost metagenome]